MIENVASGRVAVAGRGDRCHDGDARARATFAMWCALCAAAGDLLAERCAHDDVAYVNGSPLARWVMRRLSRDG